MTTRRQLVEDMPWTVEVEADGRGGAVLTVVDVPMRRKLASRYGRHNAYVSADTLVDLGFGMKALRYFQEGWPVRLALPPETFIALLEGSEAGFSGLEAPSRGVTVVPAYGRDYKDKASVVAAWDAGKDFLIQDISSPYDGRYINRQDAANAGLGFVKIRFKKLRNVVILDLDETGGGAPR